MYDFAIVSLDYRSMEDPLQCTVVGSVPSDEAPNIVAVKVDPPYVPRLEGKLKELYGAVTKDKYDELLLLRRDFFAELSLQRDSFPQEVRVLLPKTHRSQALSYLSRDDYRYALDATAFATVEEARAVITKFKWLNSDRGQ